MNTRARTLVTRFIVYTLLFGAGGTGLLWLCLPLLKGFLLHVPGAIHQAFLTALPAVLTAALASAAALAFSHHGHGTRENKQDFSVFSFGSAQ